MGNLFVDDIQNENAYPDEEILRDLRVLVRIDHREGALVDYKKDISDKDNWPEAAASFANSFGGLIIFGIEEQQGRPTLITGFDPKGVETKTRLVSILLSRLQPRPDFQLRVLSHDTDKGKEIAILRVDEGIHPPYMHSKQGEHRIYIRAGAQKTEADYLQLDALFEKRRNAATNSGNFIIELAGAQSALHVYEPPEANTISRGYYRFMLGPDDNRASRRLTAAAERRFERCIERTWRSALSRKDPVRTPTATYFRRTGNGIEQRFGVTTNGAVGFASHAFLKAQERVFPVKYFYRDVANFLLLAATYQEQLQYFGDGLLVIEVKLLDGARLLDEENLFEPRLDFVSPGEVRLSARVGLHPLTPERLEDYLEVVTNDFARSTGRVLSPEFRNVTQGSVDQILSRVSPV